MTSRPALARHGSVGVPRAPSCCLREDFRSLPALVQHIGELGLDLVEMVLASPDDWDRYCAAQWLITRGFLDESPDDELAAEMPAEIAAAPLRHVTYQREYLGWGVFVLK